MPIYSHSRLSSFEQCPLKFRFRYIDKIIPEVKDTIESFLGRVVHEALEWLYLEVKAGKLPHIDELISYYASNWRRNYHQELKINRNGLTSEDYFNKGIQFLVNYYMKHKPFDDNTLEVEKRIEIQLDELGRYKIQGFIDRLSYNLENEEYEIHDYKTANNLPREEQIAKDKQLALYALGIKESFGKDKEVSLVWHFLAHDVKIKIKKTNDELEQLKQNTINLIKEIETTTEFPAQKSPLCNWCEYKPICPAWKNSLDSDSWMRREHQKELDVFD